MLLPPLAELLKELLIVQSFIKYSVHSGNYLLLPITISEFVASHSPLDVGLAFCVGRHSTAHCTCCAEVPLNIRGGGLPEN